ncbi:MAG: 2-C-methyl-D-erythritol 2,4-cyclodiphosphate synthase, partial [Clostridia bacterium]|nr:2-C-methyl-D-erythritol 2,4-cyclodiphosphate synthase [Clostridia bacterium]
MQYCQYSFKKVKEQGYVINNIDCIVILEKPHLQKYLPLMKENVAKL